MCEYYVLKFADCYIAIGVYQGCVTFTETGNSALDAERSLKYKVSHDVSKPIEAIEWVKLN